MSRLKQCLRFSEYASIVLGLGCAAIGYVLGFFNVILSGIMALFLSNVLYGLRDSRKRIVFLFFHVTLFTFLLSRPFISMLRGDTWWYFNADSVNFALTILLITLVTLRIGSMLTEFVEHRIMTRKPRLKTPLQVQPSFNTSLQTISLLLFAVTMLFYLVTKLEKWQFSRTHEYTDLYVSFQTVFPDWMFSIASMMKYALCLFLSTLPKKSKTFPILALYVLSAVPDLLMGIRNTIVLNALFAVLYYLLRDGIRCENEEKWFGKFERIAIIVLLPLALIALSALNYLRKGEAVTMNAWQTIVDLFYKQGVTFDVLCMAYDALPDIPKLVPKNYTFGPFIDYITRGSIGSLFFDSVSLGSQNSEALALYGNSFAHSMSYIAHENYLQGGGWGSSYLLELFADWGYVGVIVGSAILGGITVIMVSLFSKSPLCRTFVLISSTQIFFIPRAEATNWFLFVITVQFWLAVAVCYIGAGLCSKSYSCFTNHKQRKGEQRCLKDAD